MEYLAKEEVMKYLEACKTEFTLKGGDGAFFASVIKKIDGMYTYRPTLQSQWVRKKRKDFIECAKCGFETLAYKNSKYCPNCGRMMANGKGYNDDQR